MIEDTIARIEERLRAEPTLSPEKREELEALIAQLRREAAQLPADRILQASPPQDEEDVRSTIGRLEDSLTEFETTHPQLVAVVNRISTVLSNMGI